MSVMLKLSGKDISLVSDALTAYQVELNKVADLSEARNRKSEVAERFRASAGRLFELTEFIRNGGK